MPLRRGCRTLSTACRHTSSIHTLLPIHPPSPFIHLFTSCLHFHSGCIFRIATIEAISVPPILGGFPCCQNHHFHCAWQEYWITQKTCISKLAKVQDYAKSQHFPHTLRHRQRNCENPGTAGSLLICATIYSISIISVCLVLRLDFWWNLCLFT